VYRGWPGIDTFASEAEVGWRVDITHCIDASSATANKATNKSASAPSVAGVQLCEEGTGRQEKYDRHSAGAGARHRRAYHRPTYREAPRRHADALPVTARRTHFQRHRTPRCIERLATRRLIVPVGTPLSVRKLAGIGRFTVVQPCTATSANDASATASD
jgi:hypothetical protein